MNESPRYMSLETLATALDVGESTIEAWVGQGKFPAPKRVGPNGMRRWSWAEVQRTIEGPQDNAAVDIGERIRNATREEVLRRDRRGVRQRDPIVHSVSKISKTGTEHQAELPKSPLVS